MKSAAFEYRRPGTVEEALALLGSGSPDVRPVAGGQSLVPAMNFRLSRPHTLVDLGGIASLRGIRMAEDGGLALGAMTRHGDVEQSDLVRERMPLLHAAMPGIAHMPIRNRGTVGGSLAHADPAGDWPALCVAGNAVLHIRSASGMRAVPAESFFRGLFSTALGEGDLLTEIRFPVWPEGRRWGLQKMTRRRGDFAITGVICLANLAAGKVAQARIVVFGATDAPRLVPEAASLLAGHKPGREAIEAAAEAARRHVKARGDLHASAEYRSELVHALTRRALEQALPEAGSTS